MTKGLLRLTVMLVTLPFLLGNQSCESLYTSLGLGPRLNDACGHSALLPYFGSALTAVPASLRSGSLVRVINPGDAVTMDFSETRLNISLNEAGEIVDAYCG